MKRGTFASHPRHWGRSGALTLAVLFVAICSIPVIPRVACVSSYGFIGVGTMNSAIVSGLCSLADPPDQIWLSPRNNQKAMALAQAFPGLVKVTPDNQAVLDSSDIVFIGLLPGSSEDVLRALRFQPRHIVVSLMSTVPLVSLHDWCAPASANSIVRAIPLPAVAHQRGATIFTPHHPTIGRIFDCLGTAVPVDTEEQLQKMMPMTALMGQFYAQQRVAQQWLELQGVQSSVAAKYIGAVFHSMSYDSAHAEIDTFAELVSEQTPGGINEQIVRELTEAGTYVALKDSLDGVLARIERRTLPTKLKQPYRSDLDCSDLDENHINGSMHVVARKIISIIINMAMVIVVMV